MGFSWPVHAQRKLQFDVTRSARTRDEADDKVFSMLLYNVAYDLDGTKTGPYLSKGIRVLFIVDQLPRAFRSCICRTPLVMSYNAPFKVLR
jgi:hypothetical protein